MILKYMDFSSEINDISQVNCNACAAVQDAGETQGRNQQKPCPVPSTWLIAFSFSCQLMSTQSGRECMPNMCITLGLLLNINYKKWMRLLFGYCAKVEGRPSESTSHLLLRLKVGSCQGLAFFFFLIISKAYFIEISSLFADLGTPKLTPLYLIYKPYLPL